MTRGAPTKYDDLRAKKALTAIERGNSRKCAAAMAGVGTRTLHTWIAENAEFRQRVHAADAKAETYVVGRLFELLEGERPSFEAIRFWLKTRRPNSWREMAPAAAPEPSNDLSGKSEEELVAAVEKWMAERKAKVG